VRVIALIDGEHHPQVVRDALDRLGAEHEIVGVLFVGGEEKVPAAVLADPRRHYGRDVVVGADLPPADADAVFDLSGEPVLTLDRRLALAAVALDRGLEYRAPGLRLEPPPVERIATSVPIVGVIGTGKRTGKTAVAGYLASVLLAHEIDPVVVSMGRGGPPEPQLVRAGARLDRGRLLEIARGGAHAASDYLEDAVLTGAAAIGTRRCGEGPAGEVFDSNLVEGVRLALSLDPGAIILEGSGASLPPVAADRTVCVTRGGGEATSGLGPLRLLRSDLVILLGDPDDEVPHDRVIRCKLEPEPVEAVPEGTRAAVFATVRPEEAGRFRAALEQKGIEVALLSANLARRGELEHDLAEATRARCDLFLTELKAAAIDMVAERAERDGVPVVWLRNRVVSLPGEPDLDGELWRLFDEIPRTATAAAGKT
jgi:cyclic 2,3-diphosphoglycerate synthetase